MLPDNRTIGETNLQEIVHIFPEKKYVILDATILSTLMACARLADFRFNYNYVAIAGKSNSLECGSIVHVFNEYYYKSIIGGIKKDAAFGFGIAAAELYIRGCKGCSDFHATPECPKPVCGHKANEFPGVRNTPKDSEGYKIGWQYVLDTCDQYHRFWLGDHWVPLEVEVVKSEVLYSDDEIEVLWKAKLDLRMDSNQGIYPVDHKTMKQLRDTNSMNNQFMGQCLVSNTQNVYINKIGFQKTLKPEEKFLRKPIGYSMPRLLEWQGETLPYYAKLLLMYAETGHWPPNFTSCEGKYGNCPYYRNVCSADPSMRDFNLKKEFMVGPEWNPTNDEED